MLFDKNIEPKCTYCKTGMPIPYSEEIACVRHGIMSPDDSCRRFIYDPIKRVPEVAAPYSPGEFTEDDFSL